MKLFMDSSTNYLYLSIVSDTFVKYFTRYGKCDHSETMVDYLGEFLKDNEISVDDIDEVYVGRGPGSYTGLRIAGTIAKVFSFCKQTAFYSFSSLDLILASVISNDGAYIARIDAKKNHSYYKAVTIKNGNIKVDIDECFEENSKIEALTDYKIIDINDEFFENGKMLGYIIANAKLYREEDFLDYTPNYIRSGI